MPDWTAIVRARLGAHAADDDVVEELAEHAAELYRAKRTAGKSRADSISEVEAEILELPAYLRGVRPPQTRLLPPPPDIPAPGLAARLRLLATDLAYGVRLLTARPLTTFIAVVTLALGIGANTAIFSVVHSMLLAPLPFTAPDRLVMLWEQEAGNPASAYILSKPNYEDLVASSKAFDAAAIWEYRSFNVAGHGEPEQVPGMRISAGIFTVLGVRPQLGRVFTPAEDVPGHDVVVISDGLWKRRYAGRADVVGEKIRLNGRPFEIIGVMPPEFRFTHRAHAVWVPIHFTQQDAPRDSHSFHAAARLRAGVSFEAAKAEVETLGQQLAARFEENEGESATITRMADYGIGPLRLTLLTMMGAVALVLAIACANVANLLLAQASVRQREFAIRAAIGASPGRLASQLIGEGVALSLAGGLAGIGVAWLGASALASSVPPAIQFAPFRTLSFAPLSWPVLLFTLVVATATGVLFSLAPAAGIANAATAATLKLSAGRHGTGPLPYLRGVLVAAEVALSMVVLAAAGLTVKSMMRLTAVDPGLNPSGVLAMQMALPQPDLYGKPERRTFCADVAREVSGLPGVVSVGAISHLPLSGANASRAFVVEGRPVAIGDDGANASYRLTCPGFFQALGIPVLKGRDFTRQDSTDAPQVAIVNEATAATYWPGENPIGRRIKLGAADSTSPWLTIVGVVRNVRHFGLDSEVRREMYRPYSQAVWPVMTITIKTATEPRSLAGPVRDALRRIDPDQPVTAVRTMDEVIVNSVGSRRFPMLLFATFAAVALLLAIVGVYGVVSYVVSQRTREIGIRMALGAERSSVVRLVVLRSLIPVGCGIAAGIAVAVATSRLLQTMLFEVRPNDPAVLGAISGVLLLASMAASWMPARRAAGVDPLLVLRQE